MARSVTRALCTIALSLSVAACGGGSGDDDDDGGGCTSNCDASPMPDADLGNFSELIAADVTIQPGDEPYRCVRLTVDRDIYVRGFKDLSPAGVHHTVLSVAPLGSPDGADGAYDCDVGDNEMQMLFASGVGSDAFVFPDGVAIKVQAGQQLKLNLHLYNATMAPLTARAGTLIDEVPADQVAGLELAEMLFAGDIILDIDPTGEPETETGACAMDAGTLLNIWPHMHKLGTHMKVTLGGTTLHDDDYTFTEQKNWPMQVAIAQDAQMVVTCTYVNDGPAKVIYGESSDEEMCFAGFYRYPALNNGMFCLP